MDPLDVNATVNVNGRACSLEQEPLYASALDFLRGLGLTGAKEGCAEGECGACSILIARPDRAGTEGASEWTAINACLIPAATLAGQEVVTAEGLGQPDGEDGLHPVQREMAVRGGSQCGYCTPGFVCSMAAEFYRADRTPAETRYGAEADAHADSHECGPNGFDLHALSGNLCRCTGYRPIRDAAYALGMPSADDPFAARRVRPPPPALPMRLTRDGAELVRPADLAEALEVLAERPGATVVAGATDWGVEVNLRGARAALTLVVDRLPELRDFAWEEDRVRMGAALTLSELEARLAGRIPVLASMFPQFGSRLIRNGATIGGNLGTASPIGDTPPALLALGATVVLASRRGEREVAMSDYFTGYRQPLKAPDELIRALHVPLPLAQVAAFHKVAKRRFDDISSVAVGYALDVEDGVVTRATIGLGGVAATPLRALATEDALVGRTWSEPTVQKAAAVMRGEGTPIDDHRASAGYRSAMLGQSLLRLFADHPPGLLDEHAEVSA
jgi:xanthine dehydrogenase small subunit